MAFTDPDEKPRSAKSSFIDPDEAPKKAALPAGKPTTQELYEDSKKKGWGTGFGPAVHELGGIVTDKTGSPLAGAATNFALNAIPAFLMSASVQGAPANTLVEWPWRRLMQGSVKPSVATFSAKEIKDGMQTMLRENVYGTTGGMDKAANLVKKLNTQVADDIAASPAKVNVSNVASRLAGPMKQAEMQVNPKADVAAVEDVWNQFLVNPLVQGKQEIPVKLAHEMKQGTYRALGGKSYGELGSSSTEAQKALARGLREDVATAVPSVVDPLKREAGLMNMMEMVAPKVAQPGNLNPWGLASLRMDHLPSAAMTLLDRAKLLQQFIAMQGYHGMRPEVLFPALTTGGLNQDELLKRKQQGLYSE